MLLFSFNSVHSSPQFIHFCFNSSPFFFFILAPMKNHYFSSFCQSHLTSHWLKTSNFYWLWLSFWRVYLCQVILFFIVLAFESVGGFEEDLPPSLQDLLPSGMSPGLMVWRFPNKTFYLLIASVFCMFSLFNLRSCASFFLKLLGHSSFFFCISSARSLSAVFSSNNSLIFPSYLSIS